VGVEVASGVGVSAGGEVAAGVDVFATGVSVGRASVAEAQAESTETMRRAMRLFRTLFADGIIIITSWLNEIIHG